MRDAPFASPAATSARQAAAAVRTSSRSSRAAMRRYGADAAAFFLASAQNPFAAATRVAPSLSLTARASGGSATAGRPSPRRASVSIRLWRTAGRTVLSARPRMSATWTRIRRRQRRRRLQRRALDLGAGILERLVDQLEALALQVAVGARRLDARLDRRIVEHRLQRLGGLVGAGRRDGAPDGGGRGARRGRSLHLVARDLLGLGGRHQPRVQRQRRRAQARRRLGPDRLLQRGPQRRRRRARCAAGSAAPRRARRRASARSARPARARAREAAGARAAIDSNSTSAARRAPASPPCNRSASAATTAAGSRAASASVASSARRRSAGSGSRSASVTMPAASRGRQRRRLLQHGRAHVRRSIAERGAQRRGVRRSARGDRRLARLTAVGLSRPPDGGLWRRRPRRRGGGSRARRRPARRPGSRPRRRRRGRSRPAPTGSRRAPPDR